MPQHSMFLHGGRNGGSKKRNNPKPTEKMVMPHNEEGFSSKKYNRGKNGEEKDK